MTDMDTKEGIDQFDHSTADKGSGKGGHSLLSPGPMFSGLFCDRGEMGPMFPSFL